MGRSLQRPRRERERSVRNKMTLRGSRRAERCADSTMCGSTGRERRTVQCEEVNTSRIEWIRSRMEARHDRDQTIWRIVFELSCTLVFN